MINLLRIANVLDSIQCYKLADRFTKVAIDLSDLDPKEVYKNPQTFSDRIVKKSLESNEDPYNLIETKAPDKTKSIEENIASIGQPLRRYFEIYPQILVFPENGVWKFFFTDPLSLGRLDKGSQKSGVLLTDQLTVNGLMEDFSNEADKEIMNYEVLFDTNLPIEDISLQEVSDKIRSKFPGASIDFVNSASLVDGKDVFDAEKDIDLT